MGGLQRQVCLPLLAPLHCPSSDPCSHGSLWGLRGTSPGSWPAWGQEAAGPHPPGARAGGQQCGACTPRWGWAPPCSTTRLSDAPTGTAHPVPSVPGGNASPGGPATGALVLKKGPPESLFPSPRSAVERHTIIPEITTASTKAASAWHRGRHTAASFPSPSQAAARGYLIPTVQARRLRLRMKS